MCGLKLLIRLHLRLSHLRVNKSNHSFSDCFDEIHIYGTNMESTKHFLLQCPFYLFKRKIFMVKCSDAEIPFLDENENSFYDTIPFGSDKFNEAKNLCILNAVTEYILATEVFNVFSLHNRNS